MTELDEYTMTFFKKASIYKNIQKVSKFLLLTSIPILIIAFNKVSSQVDFALLVGLFFTCVILIQSTRKHNFIKSQISMNLWLSEMVNKPEDFSDFLCKNGIK